VPHFYPVVIPAGRSLPGDSLGFHAYSLRIDNLTNQWLLEETSLAWIPPYSLGVCLRLYGTGVAIVLNQAPSGQAQPAPLAGEATVGVFSDQLRTEVAGSPVRQFALVQAVSDLTEGAQPAFPPVGTCRLWADNTGTIHHEHSDGTDYIVLDAHNFTSYVTPPYVLNIVNTQALGGVLAGTLPNPTHANIVHHFPQNVQLDTGQLVLAQGANAGPYTLKRLSLYDDGANWAYLAYGQDAQARFIFGKGAGGGLLFGQSTANDGTGTFTQQVYFTASGEIRSASMTASGLITAANISTGSIVSTTGFLASSDGTGLTVIDSNSRIVSAGRTTYFDEYNGGWYWRNTATGSSTALRLTGAGRATIGEFFQAPQGYGLLGADTVGRLRLFNQTVFTTTIGGIFAITPGIVKFHGIVMIVISGAQMIMAALQGGANNVQIIWSNCGATNGFGVGSTFNVGFSTSDYYIENRTGLAYGFTVFTFGLS
jgi:hypothetical protein